MSKVIAAFVLAASVLCSGCFPLAVGAAVGAGAAAGYATVNHFTNHYQVEKVRSK